MQYLSGREQDAEVTHNVAKPNVAVTEQDHNMVIACKVGSCTGIVCSQFVLNSIRTIAVDMLLSIPRGGLEVGGLLFGRKRQGFLEILAFEEFAIEHLSGAGFQLSEQDEQALAKRLEAGAPQHDAGPLEIVGWWHSHTRSDVDLTVEDLRVHRKFFGTDDRIALIIKPFKFDPARVAIYCPASEDDQESQTVCCSFTIGAMQSPPAADPPPRSIDADVPPTVSIVVPTDVTQPPPVRAERPKSPTRKRAFRMVVGMAAVVVTIGVGTYLYSLQRGPEPPTVAPDPIRLTLSGTGNELTVRWVREGIPSSRAQDAELIIVDGSDVTRIPLSADTPNTGSLSYLKRSGRVEVRMRGRLRNGELFEAVAHYVGPEPFVQPPVQAPSPEPPQDPAEVERMKLEVARLNGEVMRMRTLDAEQARSTAVAARPIRKYTPRPAAQQETRGIQYVPPPVVSTESVPAPLNLPAQLPPAPPPNAVAPKRVVAAQPGSGRAIWTGALPRGGVLLFDGGRPSSGAITGRLPTRPSRVHVYPADLISSGILVYTNDGKERTEVPSAGNGWNLTTYRPDAKRWRDLTVLEAPGQANDWRRLMVRSEQRTVSILLIEWEEVR